MLQHFLISEISNKVAVVDAWLWPEQLSVGGWPWPKQLSAVGFMFSGTYKVCSCLKNSRLSKLKNCCMFSDVISVIVAELACFERYWSC
jgi:hypothetical protein